MGSVYLFQTTAVLAFVLLVSGALVALVRGTRVNTAARDRIAALETELEAAQDALWELRESEERYRSLVEGQDDLIVRRDVRGRLTYVNDAFVAAAGRPREKLLGTDFGLPATRTERPRASGAFDQEIRTAEGVRWISWIETPVRGVDGGAAEMQAVGRDVTERWRAEAELAEARSRAEAASEAKSRFLATVSHEIRTPLNGVLGMADLLAGTGLTPEQQTYVAAVKTSGEALLSIINEILDFSKIEAGKLELANEPFDLVALVEGTVELLAPRAQDKGIALAATLAPDVPRFVLGDAARLRQVLTNLAGNAVKFTETGGVGLSVRAEGDLLLFTVADTGVGIPPERLSSIFEEFEQADGSAVRRHAGTGLGLAISRRLVAGMGGDLTVESEPGIGSAFRFAVALPEVPDAPARTAFPAGLDGLHALLVAGAPFEGDFLAERLRACGLVVARCATLEDAEAHLGEGPAPDILIADGALGEGPARALAAAAGAAGVARRIVLLSPFERRAFGPPAAAGYDAYLVKPVRERSLAAQLGAGLGAAEPCGPNSPGTRPPQGTLRVLLAEDNEINALLATRLLERNGASVVRAADGLEAVDVFRAACEADEPGFDVVLMDVRMPGLDGHEAARRIRSIEADHVRPPVRIVALTANVAEEDRRRAAAAGMNATVAKPLDVDELMGALVVDGLNTRPVQSADAASA